MNFFDYIGITEDEFVEQYVKTGLVSTSGHNEFPLVIFTYSRRAVHTDKWARRICTRCYSLSWMAKTSLR